MLKSRKHSYQIYPASPRRGTICTYSLFPFAYYTRWNRPRNFPPISYRGACTLRQASHWLGISRRSARGYSGIVSTSDWPSHRPPPPDSSSYTSRDLSYPADMCPASASRSQGSSRSELHPGHLRPSGGVEVDAEFVGSFERSERRVRVRAKGAEEVGGTGRRRNSKSRCMAEEWAAFGRRYLSWAPSLARSLLCRIWGLELRGAIALSVRRCFCHSDDDG